MAHIHWTPDELREEIDRVEKLASVVAEREMKVAYAEKAADLKGELEVLEKQAKAESEKTASAGTRKLEEFREEYRRSVRQRFGLPMPPASPEQTRVLTEKESAALYRKLADTMTDRDVARAYREKAAELDPPSAVDIGCTASHFDEMAEKAASPAVASEYRQAAAELRENLKPRPTGEEQLKKAEELEKAADRALTVSEATSLRHTAFEQRAIARKLQGVDKGAKKP